VKVLDFGLAAMSQSGTSAPGDPSNSSTFTMGVTQAGVILGTAAYMAPEQARDATKVDARADIYSLGCTLHFLLTGRPPFPGGTLGQKLIRHQFNEPPDVRELRPEVPEQVAAVLRQMLVKDPGKRFASMAEVVAALSTPATARVPEPPLAPMVALGLATFAENKVQGLALLKGASVLMIVPIAAIFVPLPWQWALGIAPTFWPARLYWALGANAPSWWIYLLAGLVYQALLLAALLRRFERVMYR
jgi:hypothetical protein